MKKIKDEELAMIINNKTFINYLNRLKLIAVSLFTWEGLDEVGGNSRFLEQVLYEEGRACFIKDDKLGYMSLRANPHDYFNNYNLPTKVEAYSIDYHKSFNINDIVYIMNNELQLPTYETIELMAYRLYDIERTIDVNLNAQKTPVVFEGDDKSILALKNAYMQFSGNVPVMYASKNFELNKKINCVKTDAPYLVDKLELQKHQVLNEALTYLGINNSNTDKKERQITDEVNSNNELIKFYLNCFYKTRKRAADEINKKFFNGEKKIKITINNNLNELINISSDDIIKIGDDDE